MERQVSLTEDAQQALAGGAHLCRWANIAIFTPEHLLGGALLALRDAGLEGLPGPADIASALEMIHGTGEDVPPDDVSFGPGARAVFDTVALAAIEAGQQSIGARELATGAIASGEMAPMFITAMGTTKEFLLAAVARDRPPSGG